MIIDFELKYPDSEWRVFFDPYSTEYTIRDSISVTVELKITETAGTGERFSIRLYPANGDNSAQYYVWLPVGFEVRSVHDAEGQLVEADLP